MKTNISLTFAKIKSHIFKLLDFSIILVTLLFSVLVDQRVITPNVFIFIFIYSIITILLFTLVGMYRSLIDHIGVTDMVKIFFLVFGSNILLMIITMANEFWPVMNIGNFNQLSLTFVAATESFFLVAIRYTKRIIKVIHKDSNKIISTLIIGAGQGGKLVFDEILNNDKMLNDVKAFVDDSPEKIGKKFLNKPVEGPSEHIRDVIQKYAIEEVIIAISNFSKDDLHKLIQFIGDANVRVRRLPLIAEMGLNDTHKIIDVSLEELLGREPITFDTKEISEFIRDKVVLITGAGGSIGSELCRQIYSYHPKTLIQFDIYENGVYEIQQELIRKKAKDGSGVEIITLIGSTYNNIRVRQIFDKYHPELVFHAAAYKHVPLMEDSPMEAIRTNILGTYNVAKASMDYGVQKMVLVSTDKAVRPTNVMGATKRYAEMVIQHFSTLTKNTAYSAVRFGNVLGSNGSVIPLFEKQIAEGGPITITHKDITRFFMTIPEAVSLILQSGVYATDGEIFILDMGKPVKIVDLAEKIIRQTGLVPEKDIDIEFIGLRPGEKLFEEILIDVNKHGKTSNNKIYVERNNKNKTFAFDENHICDIVNNENNQIVVDLLANLVDTYKNPAKAD